MTDTSQAYDYIIVGGGTAGCTLASRLYEGSPTGTRIIIIERGPDERKHEYVTEAAKAPLLRSTNLVRTFKTVPQEELGGRIINNVTGNLLSGSSGK